MENIILMESVKHKTYFTLLSVLTVFIYTYSRFKMWVTSMLSPSWEHHHLCILCLKLLHMNAVNTKEGYVCLFAQPTSDTSGWTCTLWPLTFQNVESRCHMNGGTLTALQHISVNRGCVNEDNICRIYSWLEYFGILYLSLFGRSILKKHIRYWKEFSKHT